MESTDRLPVFVYGTLRPGQGNYSRLLAGREVGTSGTWGCGYTRPTARMQYTGSSFVQPLADFTRAVLLYRRCRPEELPYFPSEEPVATESADLAERGLFRPAFAGGLWLLARGRFLQSGHLRLYVLYIALTLLALLVWSLGWKA